MLCPTLQLNSSGRSFSLSWATIPRVLRVSFDIDMMGSNFLMKITCTFNGRTPALSFSLSSSLSLSPPYLQYHQTKNAIDFTRTPGDEIAKKSERKLEKQKQIKTSWVVCLCYCLSICILVYFLNNGHSAKILITTVPLIISNERISICYENLLQVTFVKFSQLLKLCVIFKQKFERECRQKRRVITL